MYPGTITDRKGQLIVTMQTDQKTQGFIVVNRQGDQVGIYLDDSTPNLAKWVTEAYQTSWQYKFVSVPMNKAAYHWPGMINLFEYYPYNSGWIPSEVPKSLPKGKYAGYILQKQYPGYILAENPKAKAEPPTPAQFRKILALALLKFPNYIFYF